MVVEDLLSDLAASGAPWSIVNLRYFNPAGAHSTHLIGENPNATPTNLFPVIVRSLQDPNPRVRVFGTDYPTADGTCIRDYVHVVDLADGHVNALRAIHNSNQYWTVNLGTGSGCSVLEVVRAFELVSSVPIALDYCPRRPGDAAVSVADTSRALELLGWKSKYSLADMCFDSFEFARKRRG